MRAPAKFSLYHHITGNESHAKVVLGGSATPGLTLDEIKSLSSDPAATSKVFQSLFTDRAMTLTSARGGEELRQNIASTYAPSSRLTADDVIAVNATSGANHILYRSVLAAGDHVVVQYPTYGPLIEEPRDIGCEISFLRLDPSKGWSLDVEQLRRLIRPGKTKMIVLNNPSNPTGAHLDDECQRSIIRLAKEHDIIIHCDEIFRPLFHPHPHPSTSTSTSTSTPTTPPSSLNDHADLSHDLIVTTSSLSKVYGLSGVRVGWLATRSPVLSHKFWLYRQFSVAALSHLDEVVATEALSPRCRPHILEKHLAMARRNLALIQNFVDRHGTQCDWVRPTAGAVAFVRFKDARTGHPVDDGEFCRRLVQRKGVLLSPASECFEFDDDDGDENGRGLKGEFKGRVRFHFTTRTDVVERGLRALEEFLSEERNGADLGEGALVNGSAGALVNGSAGLKGGLEGLKLESS